MEAGVEVHVVTGREQGEPLATLQLHEEVVGAVVVGVRHETRPPHPHVDLHRGMYKQPLIKDIHYKGHLPIKDTPYKGCLPIKDTSL